MRKHDKIKNIQKANMLMEQLYLATKPVKGIIYEDFRRQLNESEIPNMDNLKTNIEKAGGDIDDKNVQMSFLNNLVDSDFNISKINPQEVVKDAGNPTQDNSNKQNVNESGGHGGPLMAILHAAHNALEYTEGGVEIGSVIEKNIGKRIAKEMLKKGLHFIEEILNFIPDIFEKAIYKFMKWCGVNVEVASLTAKSGPVIWMLILAGVAIAFFPSALSAAVGFWGIATLLLKIWSFIKTIWGIFKKVMGMVDESTDKLLTFSDLLRFFEEKFNSDFSWEVRNGGEKFYNKLNDKLKQDFSGSVKHMKRLVDAGREIGEDWGKMETYYKFPSDLLDRMASELGNKETN
jgi:hypothetical protein